MAATAKASREGSRPEMFDLWLRRQLEATYGVADRDSLSPELEALLVEAR